MKQIQQNVNPVEGQLEDEEAGLTVTDTQQVAPNAIEFDVDAILDEIDETLSTSATEFVNTYVQQGGQ